MAIRATIVSSGTKGETAMRLSLSRSQVEERGFFGGHKGMKFQLSCRAELSPQEDALITKYKADGELLAVIVLDDEQPQGDALLHIRDLVSGRSYECKNVATLLAVEEKVKTACQNFKTLLTVMESFGGEEVMEF
jgi:hypothetical protein